LRVKGIGRKRGGSQRGKKKKDARPKKREKPKAHSSLRESNQLEKKKESANRSVARNKPTASCTARKTKKRELLKKETASSSPLRSEGGKGASEKIFEKGRRLAKKENLPRLNLPDRAPRDAGPHRGG